jgi:hypothetical protein
MIEKLLTRYQWLRFSNEQRLLMRQTFNIPKSGGVEMMGNQMISDGSNEKDLKVVNIASMQEFTESNEKDFDKLLELTIEKIDVMIKEEAEEKEAVAAKAKAKVRNKEISEVVQSILETINNLPLDARMQIKSHLGTESNEQESTSTKETKKGRNKRGTEEAGS